MPKGPKGEKRPAELIGNAVKVMRIATEEDDLSPSGAGTAKTTPECRSKVAKESI